MTSLLITQPFYVGHYLKYLITLLVSPLELGDIGCYDTCAKEPKFFKDGSCAFCNGYCCGEGLSNSYCSKIVMAQVSFPFPGRLFCLKPLESKTPTTATSFTTTTVNRGKTLSQSNLLCSECTLIGAPPTTTMAKATIETSPTTKTTTTSKPNFFIPRID